MKSQQLILHSSRGMLLRSPLERRTARKLTTEDTEDTEYLLPDVSRSGQAPTVLALTVGSLACCQASIPPITLITCLKPARCSRLLAMMLRYPPLQ
jgi:hypothetical protein